MLRSASTEIPRKSCHSSFSPGTTYGISRDHPPEIIARARQRLWRQFKAARENPYNRVSIGYPAKLIVNGTVVNDMSPDWDLIVKGSRLPLPKQSSETINTPGFFLNKPPPPTSVKHSGLQEIPAMQGIPGNSINLSAAKNDIGSHEYMEAETEDLNGASDSPNKRNSPIARLVVAYKKFRQCREYREIVSTGLAAAQNDID